jgi:hypothetical protein
MPLHPYFLMARCTKNGFKLKLTRPEELETLMDEKAYKKYCETLE